MNAVGIDVSKGKSMVAALRPKGEVALLPQEFLHTEIGLEQMAYAIIALQRWNGMRNYTQTRMPASCATSA